MKRFIAITALAGVALAAGACTDSKRASRAATWGDQPADITCWSYGEQTYSGRSTGKVEYDEGGRVSFVDAATGRYTTIEGDCRMVYVAEGEDPAPAPAPAPAPVPAPAPSGTPAA